MMHMLLVEGVNRIAKKVTYIRNALRYVGLLAKHYCLKPIAQKIYGRKHIWLISERGTDARDNGYWFYRYLRQSHPQQRICYVIEKNSPDYPKVASLGEVVERYSLKHWLLYLAADVKISTHNNGLVPAKHWRYRKFLSHLTTEENIVFLQHGVTKDDMKGLYKENTNIKLFICGAKPEYDYILSKYGYSAEEVKYTGFARFDGLHHTTTKRQVLVMPTWRDWLSPDFHGSDLSAQDVEQSLYVQRWRAFLKNKQLRILAQKYGVSFVFYPHYEMQRFLSLFSGVSDCVAIADFAHFDVQQLLKESILLVTDYSSVFFDFAYMQKPVLYYQFDEKEYRAHHYAQGYFDYRRDGFGEVAKEETELLDLLAQYLAENCCLKPEYQLRVQNFFPLHDDKNCERIYKEIQKL